MQLESAGSRSVAHFCTEMIAGLPGSAPVQGADHTSTGSGSETATATLRVTGDSNAIVLDGTVFGPGTCTVTSEVGIATRNDVEIEDGADVTFSAPTLGFGTGFRVATGGIFDGRYVGRVRRPDTTRATDGILDRQRNRPPSGQSRCRSRPRPGRIPPIPTAGDDAHRGWSTEEQTDVGGNKEVSPQPSGASNPPCGLPGTGNDIEANRDTMLAQQ